MDQVTGRASGCIGIDVGSGVLVVLTVSDRGTRVIACAR
jgi:hypothetical protein